MIDITQFPGLLLLKSKLESTGAFQPVGFKDVGHCTYQIGTDTSVIVDTAAAVANHLEQTAIDVDSISFLPIFKGLPYVRAIHNDLVVTTSLIEPHRLASYYLFGYKDKKKVTTTSFGSSLIEKLANKNILPRYTQILTQEIFNCDPNSIVHGCFFPYLAGSQNRLTRLILGTATADKVTPVDLGGVKTERITSAGGDSTKGTAQIPYFRTLYRSDSVYFDFRVDINAIRRTGLPIAAQNLLLAISLWKIQKLVSEHYRPRTECILIPRPIEGYHELPTLAELELAIPDLIEQAYQHIPLTERITNVILPADYLETATKIAKSETVEEPIEAE
jgi:CRISPR-associated protein Csb1